MKNKFDGIKQGLGVDELSIGGGSGSINHGSGDGISNGFTGVNMYNEEGWGF